MRFRCFLPVLLAVCPGSAQLAIAREGLLNCYLYCANGTINESQYEQLSTTLDDDMDIQARRLRISYRPRATMAWKFPATMVNSPSNWAAA